MSEHHLDPAKTVIAKLGGVEAVCSITGKHLSRVYRWMHPKEKGGTGGLIPTSEAPKLLEHAKVNNIKISADDFFPKRDIAA